MRVILFGTGAMACFFGARLSPAAHVTLVGTWTEGIEAIRQHGILVEDFRGSRTVQVQAEYIGARLMPADLAIILVKSWQTERIARHVPEYLKPDGIAISLQNGLGNLELLGSRAFPGATSEGATLLGPAHVRLGGSGPTSIVAPAWVAEVLASGGFDCRCCSPDSAAGLLWGKLSVSCGINALTALLRIPNGALLNRPDATSLMVRAALECAGVAQALGIELLFADPAAQVRDVAKRTAANQSSMLQDLLRGAPTECDAINGAVVREAGKLGMTAPVNEMLWQLVRAASHQDRSDIP
jgi:2-dehydropantoate 2-reductase